MDAASPLFRPFEHVTVPKAELYRAIMRVFVEHKQRFVVHLRPEDVARELPEADVRATTDEVEKALDALAAWGNVRGDADTSRVASVEDFYRRRVLYQLTREGEAAEEALALYEDAITRRGELQSVALEDIRLRLRSLAALAAESDPDPAVVHSVLIELAGRLDSLAANASAFMSSLQRVIDLQELDEDAFLAYKDRLIAYLERFVADLVQKSFDIRQTLQSVDGERVDALLLAAARREAGDAVPGADEGDVVAARLAQWRQRWRGLQTWFVGSRLRPSQSELLRRRAGRAVPDLLAAIRLVQERRAGRSDRSADYRALAQWFAEADDDEAHRLWRVMFGLGPSRHLVGLSGDPDGDPVPAGTSWLEAPPVEVAARLRQTGHYQRRGAPTKISDRTAARAELQARVTAEREQVERARRAIATGRPTRLADLGGVDGLDAGALTLFLRLLGDALAAGPPGPDGSVTTLTSDGSFEVTLRPVPDGGLVAVRSSEGVIWAPDHVITVTDLTRPVPPAATTVPGPAVTFEGAEAVADGGAGDDAPEAEAEPVGAGTS